MLYPTDASQPILGRAAVHQWLRQHPEDVNHKLELIKLALCPEYFDSTIVKHIYKELKVPVGDFGEVEVLMRDVFAILRKAVPDFMRHYRTGSSRSRTQEEGKEYWDDIPLELQITVPCHWKRHQCGILYNAAGLAGFKQVYLRSEPLCASAKLMFQYWREGAVEVNNRLMCCCRSNNRVLTSNKDGDVKTFIDIGRSTTVGTTTQSTSSSTDLH